MRSLEKTHRELHRIAQNVLLLNASSHFASEAVMALLDRLQQQTANSIMVAEKK